MFLPLHLGESALLAAALSTDAFLAAFAYGSDGIRIPFLSAQIVNGICSGAVLLSMTAGSGLRGLLPDRVTAVVCFLLLFCTGLVKLLNSLTRSWIRKHSGASREVRFRLFHFRFVLSLYADPEKADRDHSKTISPGEAASLALALSLDGLAVGVGAALGNIRPGAVFLCSLAIQALAVPLGARLGNRVSRRCSAGLSWLGGALLMALGVAKLF